MLVAPRAGAWIETPPIAQSYSLGRVAPRAGAWIETKNFNSNPDTLRRAPCGRVD